MRVLINAVSTKSITGGAYQIAINYIRETINHQNIEWFYIISQDLENDVLKLPINRELLFIFPTQPSRSFRFFRVRDHVRRIERIIKPDIIYSLSAPSYMHFTGREVMRFNNAWITNPNSYAWNILPFKKRIRMSFYRLIQKHFLKQCHYFITQTEVLKEGIIKITKVPDSNVRVISNVLPKVYSSYDRDSKKLKSGTVNIMCVATDILHKNLDIIPDVISILVNSYEIKNVLFHITLPETSDLYCRIKDSLEQKGLSNYVMNHGHCSQDQLASLYLQANFSFIPSLLETMSASIIEALYFKLPMVLTDLPFNKSVLGDAGLYYTPKDADAAAACFARLIRESSLSESLIDKMESVLPRFGDYNRHFNETICFFNDIVREQDH